MLHLKDGMGLRIKKILILWGFIEKSDFGEGGHEIPIYREELPKKGSWTVGRFKEGTWQKEMMVFLRELILQCTLCTGGLLDFPSIIVVYI